MRSTLFLPTLFLLLNTGCRPTSPPVSAAGGGGASSPIDHDRAGFPVIVSLSALGNNAATGETDLLLTFDVNRPPGYPLAVTVTVPPGVQLVGGAFQESLVLANPGQVQRRFRIVGPLSQQAPFQVVVHGQAPDRSSGIHSEQRYPMASAAPSYHRAPPPPGGRPPGVPR